MRHLPPIVAAAILLAGCLRVRPPIPVDPSVTFSVHLEPGAGLIVDRPGDGGGGRLRPGGWGFQRSGLRFVLDAGEGQSQASFRLLRPGEAVVWRTADDDTAPLGRVAGTWDDNAIQLSLEAAGQPPLTGDAFAREGGGTGPSVLSRRADTSLDVRGTYRASLRDPGGHPVGWLQVRIGPYQVAPRLYDGVLPAAVDPLLGVAAALALDAEVDWILDHAIDVHQGKDGGPLQDSGLSR